MSKVEVELNSAGVLELLNSKEMKEMCSSRARQTVGALGDGYVAIDVQMPTRPISIVETASIEAMRENVENNTILKALR